MTPPLMVAPYLAEAFGAGGPFAAAPYACPECVYEIRHREPGPYDFHHCDPVAQEAYGFAAPTEDPDVAAGLQAFRDIIAREARGERLP